MLILSTLVLLGALRLTESRCTAQVTSSDILKGYKSNLAKLKSGDCTVRFNSKVKQYYRNAESARVVFAPQGLRIESRYLKDKAIKQFYADQPDYKIDDSTKTLTGYYIRTKKETIQWLDGMYTVAIQPLKQDTNEPAYVNIFDLRSFGLCTQASLFIGRDVDSLVEWLSNLKADSVAETSPNIFEVEWSKSYKDGASGKWTITFDRNKGYSPIKQILYDRDSEDEPWKVLESSETKWTKKSDAWVPIEFTCKDVANKETLEFKLDWQSVNQKIPDSLFGYEAFSPTPPPIVSVVKYTKIGREEIKPRGVAFKQKIVK